MSIAEILESNIGIVNESGKETSDECCLSAFCYNVNYYMVSFCDIIGDKRVIVGR